MHYTEIAPSAPLASFVKCYWSLEQSASPAMAAPEPVIPDGCLELIFNLSDPFRRYHKDGSIEIQPRTMVAGQMRHGAVIEPTGRVELFGIRFHHAGAFPFFSFPLNELTDQIIDLNLVWGARGRALTEQVGGAATLNDRVSVTEKVLLELLRAGNKADGLVGSASRLILNHRGTAPIDQIAGQLDISGRRLERRFLSRVGISPKSFSRIIRFQHFVNSARQTPMAEVLDLALVAGYYDQSHLIHECRKFTGKSPTEFLDREHRLSDAFLSETN